MLRPLAIQKQRATAVTLPAPTGGWNTRDGLAEMPELDAVTMENFWPSTVYVEARKGYTPWSVSVQGYVETLASYSGSTTNILLAATSAGTIYSVTTADSFLTTETGTFLTTESGQNLVLDVTGSTTEVTGLTNGRWQHTNFANTGGNYVIMANGADDVRAFDGTTWTTPTITGVTSANLIHVNNHKNRLWFVETGSLKAWYLGTQAIAGAANALDLRSVARRGGFIQAIATWTIDAGFGVDDLWVAFTSNGEVIVYRGTDPTSAATWALVGVWEIGAPIGRRCFIKFGGDLLLITRDGIVPMAGALQSAGAIPPHVAISDKIKSTISADTLSYAGNFGWQIVHYPNANQLYLNMPQTERITQFQYVMNTITGAWCKFSGWNSGCWEVFNDILYFGGFEIVGRAWDGTSDAGAAIAVNGLQAFSHLKHAAKTKRMTMFQPVIYTNGSPSLFGGVNVDYDTTKNASALSTAASLYGTWDSGVWDTALWAPDLDVRKTWNGAVGVGDAFAPTITGSLNGTTIQWVDSTLVYEVGGIL